MYVEIFQQLGLSKNEARIYEVLIGEGELTVGQISQKAQIHRRNVYDSLDRLVEKGLAFSIIAETENRYQAVGPKKLMEFLEEKQALLSRVMPQLEALFQQVPRQEQVIIYRGIEGWKNYMRDILRIGEDFYCIGGKGAWMDPKLHNFLPRFFADAIKNKIRFNYLFDHEVKESGLEITQYIGPHYRFLPPGYSTRACLDVFGSHVNVLSDIHLGRIGEEFSLTVIISEQLADACRTWFRLMWDMAAEPKPEL